MPTEPTKVPEPQPPAMLNWSLACSSSGQLMSTSSLDTGLMSGMIFSWSKCPMPASWRIVCINSARLYNSPGRV